MSRAAPADPRLALAEKDLQRQIIALAKTFGWAVYHPLLSKWSEKGWPDLAMIRGPRMIAAELKAEKGTVTEHQQAWLDALAEVPGIECYVWRPSSWYAGEVERVLLALK